MKKEQHETIFSIWLLVIYIALSVGMAFTDYSLWFVVPSVVYALLIIVLFTSTAVLFAVGDEGATIYPFTPWRIILLYVGYITQGAFLYTLWHHNVTFSQVIVVLYVMSWLPVQYYRIQRRIRG